MGLFKKKANIEEEIMKNVKAAEEGPSSQEEVKKESVSIEGKVGIELERIKTQLEALNEWRKATSERFGNISEQIGELRGMITDLTKAISKIEVAATKAIDSVQAVQPEKLMIELQKEDMKVEALKANIESSEVLVKDLIGEVKKLRQELRSLQSIEQMLKLAKEVQQELIAIKKVEATVERHASKVETIFVEVTKHFQEFDRFNEVTKQLDRQMQRLQTDFDKMKVDIDTKANKKEFVDLLNKFNKFEKHTIHLLNLLDQRSNRLQREVRESFKQLVKEVNAKLNIELKAEDILTKAEASIEKSRKLKLPFFKKSEKQGVASKQEEGSQSQEQEKTQQQGGQEKENKQENQEQGGEKQEAQQENQQEQQAS